jgi:hypothetical protein
MAGVSRSETALGGAPSLSARASDKIAQREPSTLDGARLVDDQP